jgi:hypothetical protein
LSDLANGITAEIIYVDNGFSQVVGGMDEVWVFHYTRPWSLVGRQDKSPFCTKS